MASPRCSTTPIAAPAQVGPGRTLTQLARQQPALVAAAAPCQSLRASSETRADMESVVAAAGQLWTQGVDVDWAAFWSGESRNRVAWPTDPFSASAIGSRPRVVQRPVRRAPRTRSSDPRWPTGSTCRPGSDPACPRRSLRKKVDPRTPAGSSWSMTRRWRWPWSVTCRRSANPGHGRRLPAQGSRSCTKPTTRVSPARRDDWDALFERLHEHPGIPSRIGFWSLVSEQERGQPRRAPAIPGVRLLLAAGDMTQALGARTLSHPVHIAVVTKSAAKRHRRRRRPRSARRFRPRPRHPEGYPHHQRKHRRHDPRAGEPGRAPARGLLKAECAAPSA